VPNRPATNLQEVRSALRDLDRRIEELVGAPAVAMDDLVAQPDGAASPGSMGGELAVKDKHGNWVELPRGASTDVLAGNDAVAKRVGWSSRLTDVEADKVAGPVPSVDNTLARWDGTTGAKLEGSGIILNDNDSLGAVLVQSTEPSNPVEGSMWLQI